MPSGKGARERRREARMELQRQWCEDNGVPFDPNAFASPITSASDSQSDVGSTGNVTPHYRRANTADEGAMNAHTRGHAQSGQPSNSFHKSKSVGNVEILDNASGRGSPLTSGTGRRTPKLGDAGSSSAGIEAPRRRVQPQWIGNLRQMVRPAQKMNSPQSDTEPGQSALFVDDDDEPSGLQDEEISQLESLLSDLEAKERELDGVHLELLTTTQEDEDAALLHSTVGQHGSSAQGTAGGAAGNGEGGGKGGGQAPSRGPAIIHQTEESGPRGVCESPSSAEGQEERMASPPCSPQPDAWQQGAKLRAAAIARKLQQGAGPRGLGGGGSQGRQRKAWKTLFASRVRKLEKELRSLEEEDCSLDAVHAELRASVGSSLRLPLSPDNAGFGAVSDSPVSAPPSSLQATPESEPALQPQTV